MNPELIATATLVALAIAHSALGETEILRPLFASDWSMPIPRWAVERILRFAWHLTSIAWLALAVIVAGGDPLPLVAAMSLASAAVVFVMLRGHLAWPLFLLGGLAATRADGRLGTTSVQIGAWVAVGVLLVAAAVHVYWAFGGRWMFDVAVPENGPGGRPFRPGQAITLLVAATLTAFAALIAAVTADLGPGELRWLVGIGVGVLTVRAVGDTKITGFTKTVRGTRFAVADDRWFTPLVVFLALGAGGALLT